MPSTLKNFAPATAAAGQTGLERKNEKQQSLRPPTQSSSLPILATSTAAMLSPVQEDARCSNLKSWQRLAPSWFSSPTGDGLQIWEKFAALTWAWAWYSLPRKTEINQLKMIGDKEWVYRRNLSWQKISTCTPASPSFSLD